MSRLDKNVDKPAGNRPSPVQQPTAHFGPHTLLDALGEAGRDLEETETRPGSTTSEEDYYDLPISPALAIMRRRGTGEAAGALRRRTFEKAGGRPTLLRTGAGPHQSSSERSELADQSRVGGKHRRVVLGADEEDLRQIVRNGLQRVREEHDASSLPLTNSKKRRGKFSDLVFTHKFSAFDQRNEESARSPFHGFYTLFWIATSLFMLKIGAENYKKYGSPLGRNEIMTIMFGRDVVFLLLSDLGMCAITAVSWLQQVLILKGYLDWDRSGWIIQNVWQSCYIGSVVGWTLIREWPWTHTVFFVLHGITMLMKQHSYAFYNGHLSSAYKMRERLLTRLKQLDHVDPVQVPSKTEPSAATISASPLSSLPSVHDWKERCRSAERDKNVADLDQIAQAIESGEPLDEQQVCVFESILKWEVDALANELKGEASSPDKAYPHNLTLLKQYEFNLLPTLVYELEYPRSDSIDWIYVAEKVIACFGVIFSMVMISQAFIYPVVMETIHMKETGMPLAERFQAFPWMLSDLIFPFMMEYLLSWYLIWETILNFLAELTYFADRSFYDAWWNSVSWDQFARDWNRPVHTFLLRHVYHSSISAMKVNKHTATLITFFLSACVHELVMWCIFKKLRGYLLMLQMFQLPLVRLSRTKWLRNREALGNAMFWLGIFTGPSVLCSLYLIL